MHIFYCPDISQKPIVQLPESEMHHAVHVLRLITGDRIQLIDGTGKIYEAEIIAISKKHCAVNIISAKQEIKKWKIHIHIAVAPTKSSDRFDFFLEKATEIGINEITPLLCKNSERRKINTEKETQTVIAAMKQSGKAFLPKLNPLTDIKTFMQSQQNIKQQKYIAHCRDDAKKLFSKIIQPDRDILLLIGPEGDFTHEEILLAEKNNFTAVSLGEYRLRTETAAIAAVQTIHTILELHKK
jgi:16S rRNA (uracil1498-N3)-methyltransferase